MAISDHVDFARFFEGVKRRNPGQPECVQAVQEVAEDIFDFIKDKEEYHEYQILHQLPSPTGLSASASAGRTTKATSAFLKWIS